MAVKPRLVLLISLTIATLVPQADLQTWQLVCACALLSAINKGEMMEVWAFDGVTHVFSWPVICQPDPQVPGEFIKPEFYLTVKPPPTGPNEVAVAQDGDWVVMPDFTGQVFYDANGVEHVIEEIGQSPNPEWTDTPPLTLEQRRARMVVKRGQGRIVLHEDGLLETVESFVSSPECPMIVKIAYEDAAEWMRLSTTTAAMIQLLGLSDEQADDLFTRASAVQY